jgi:hypothetical protein
VASGEVGSSQIDWNHEAVCSKADTIVIKRSLRILLHLNVL